MKKAYACLALNQIYADRALDPGEDAGIVQLAASIARHGLLQPVIVLENEDVGRYKLVSGYRRLRACRIAGLTCVDAIVLACSEQEAAACRMEEHMTRAAPSIVDEARAVARAGVQGVTAHFVLDRALLDAHIDLLVMPERVRHEIKKHRLSLEQAAPLRHIGNEQRQLEAVSIIAQRALSGMQARRLVYGASSQTDFKK